MYPVPQYVRNQVPIISKPFIMYPKLETMYPVTLDTMDFHQKSDKKWNHPNNVLKLS